MRATRKQLETLASELGADIEYDFATTGIAAYAPDGMVWVDSGCPLLVMEAHAGWTGRQSWKPAAYAQLVDAMEAGLMPE